MDQEIEIINTSTRIEKIKNFFINNKKSLISFFSTIIIIIVSYFFYVELKEKEKIELENRYNFAVMNLSEEYKYKAVKELKDIIGEKDKTYSPLALYFLIDNNLIKSNNKINNYFDLIINEIKLDKEIKNLIIFKKGLFNSDFANEKSILDILNPLINSDSARKSHALYLMAEYFFSKNEKQKSKEFFKKIISLKNSNPNIKLEAQKRIRKDFSE